MIDKLWRKVKENGEAVRYILVGGGTTVVNYAVYYLLTRMVGVGEMWSNVWSFAAAVVFAYVMNKWFVFASKTHTLKALLLEAGSFLAMRLVSWGLDQGIFWLLFKQLRVYDLLAKLVSNVVVIASNYVFSKLFIFKGSKKTPVSK